MNTQKKYGYSGNSCIAAVEFGARIKAKTVMPGGESFDPASKHYTDQAGMYIEGKFKDVLFYKQDVEKTLNELIIQEIKFVKPFAVMIKKNVFILPLMLLCCAALQAQSIKFSDLVVLASMNNDNVYSTLKQGDAFKQDYSENVDGYDMEYFKNAGPKPNTERITVGAYTKLYNGTILRTVDYNSTDVQNLLNMISQAKRYGLEMQFQGADEANNIYLFSNSFYMVNISIRRDQTAGTVEIKQKEYLDID